MIEVPLDLASGDSLLSGPQAAVFWRPCMAEGQGSSRGLIYISALIHDLIGCQRPHSGHHCTADSAPTWEFGGGCECSVHSTVFPESIVSLLLLFALLS